MQPLIVTSRGLFGGGPARCSECGAEGIVKEGLPDFCLCSTCYAAVDRCSFCGIEPAAVVDTRNGLMMCSSCDAKGVEWDSIPSKETK